MGPRVKFAVDKKATQMLEKQLITNDLGGRERIEFMVFKLGNETWDLVTSGAKKPSVADLMKLCPDTEGRQLIFRSKDDSTDVWCKYIPDAAPVKMKTHYATGSESLFDETRGCKTKVESRDKTELKEVLAKYL